MTIEELIKLAEEYGEIHFNLRQQVEDSQTGHWDYVYSKEQRQEFSRRQKEIQKLIEVEHLYIGHDEYDETALWLNE